MADFGTLVEDVPETYRKAFEDSTETIVITDPGGHIVRANRAWLDRYGYRLEEVRGKTTRIVQSEHTGREVYAEMWEAIGDPARGSWTGEVANRTRHGEEVPIELTITPIRRAGAIVGYMGRGTDLTEKKRLEDQQRLYDTVVRHDLKAPLAAIHQLAETLGAGFAGELPAAAAKLVERIVAQADRMLAIIATSLDLERLRRARLHVEPVDADAVAIVHGSRETLDGAAAAKQVRISIEAAAPELPCRLDAVHLQRCTDNLLKNAVEAAPGGSTVTVRAAIEAATLVITVHNPGPPIPADVRALLFHPFSTYGKRGGTGLGVYGVKLTVEAMGGSVEYRTGAGGTTFELRVPAGLA